MSKNINIVLKNDSRLKYLRGKIYINRCVGHNTVVVNMKLFNYKILSVKLNGNDTKRTV